MVHAVFVHGSGRAGSLAWPGQVVALELRRRRCEFLDVSHVEDAADEVAAVLAALGAGAHLVAHSQGAVGALSAAERAPDLVRSLVLFEPAAFAAARGGPRVEAHVARMSAVFGDAANPLVRDGDFAVRFLTVLGSPGTALADPGDPTLRSMGQRLRRRTPPWETPTDADVVGRVPTLVVTGDWNGLYEEVADALAAHGAERRVLSGYGHRPQDHPEANALLSAFWAAHD